MSGAATARRRVVQHRIGGAEMSLPQIKGPIQSSQHDSAVDVRTVPHDAERRLVLGTAIRLVLVVFPVSFLSLTSFYI